MKQRIANCPSCGGPIEFQLSTALVTVCDFCHSVIARTDKSLEDHGKVADLVETNSPIKRGMTGQFEKKNFDIVGRVQYQHPAGGVWDEYYLRFPGDRVRWLAAAQGKFYLTTEKRLNENSGVPGYADLKPGRRFEFGEGKSLVVAEMGVATARSADGDIPWDFRPNAEHRFADLQGQDREFATIEYEDSGPRLFLGREVVLDELNLAGDSWEMEAPPTPNTAALQLNCPQCGGPLTLHAPDETQRVCCPSCKALLDCQQGKLEYLQTLKMKPGEKPLIPLGSMGRLFDVEYTVIGFMERYVIEEGKKYSWTEYLLHNPKIGFRWLVRSKGHWSFVEAIPVSSIEIAPQQVLFENESFRIYDKGTAHVQYVIGEFYWRVTIAEEVQSTDFIAPPRMISLERTNGESGSELNVSLGTYVEKETIEEAFHVTDIPAAWGVGSIQPAPKMDRDVIKIWIGFLCLLGVLDLIYSSGKLTQPVHQFHFFVSLIVVSLWPLFGFLRRRHFEVQRWQESGYSPYRTEEDDDE